MPEAEPSTAKPVVLEPAEVPSISMIGLPA